MRGVGREPHSCAEAEIVAETLNGIAVVLL
jgi:hypothetical protein